MATKQAGNTEYDSISGPWIECAAAAKYTTLIFYYLMAVCVMIFVVGFSNKGRNVIKQILFFINNFFTLALL